MVFSENRGVRQTTTKIPERQMHVKSLNWDLSPRAKAAGTITNSQMAIWMSHLGAKLEEQASSGDDSVGGEVRPCFHGLSFKEPYQAFMMMV